MKRTATITWRGTGKEGSGQVTTQSHVLEKAHLAWNTRFENGVGTNPEELIAAAHASCFTMKLSFILGDAGFVPESLETTAEVTLDNNAISHSNLTVNGIVPGLSNDKFLKYATDARDNCMVSKALNLEITMEAHLHERASL